MTMSSKGSQQWLAWAGGVTWIASLAFVAGCGGGDGDNGDGSPGPGRGNTSLTLEQACAASCEAQAATGCPGVFPAARCTEFCIDLPESFRGCETAWRNINACMAEAPLFCDQVNGGAAVSSEDCGPEIDALATCM